MMTRVGRAARKDAVVMLVATALLAACHGCGGDRVVGELEVIAANVDRDFNAQQNAWQGAKVGDRFEMGDGLKTGHGATAQLALSRGGRLLVQSDTTMRFTRVLAEDAQRGRRIDIEQGEVMVETGPLDLGVTTPRGVVTLASSSQVKVRAEVGQVRFDVLVGRAELAQPDGPQIVRAGRGFDVTVLPAMAEEPSPAPAAGAAEPVEEPGDAPGLGPALRELRFQESPPSSVVTVPFGEAAEVHDPFPPSDLRIPVTRCQGLAVLEFDRGNGRYDAARVRGTGEVRVRLPAGSYRYRARCVRAGRVELASAGTGRLTIRRDVATRPLPSQPVAITADADGRRYTISYQNRLPVITLRWPDAPAATAYTLDVTPEHGTAFSLHSGKPSVTLPAGRLGEGLHSFAFEGGGKRSEQGLLRVAFDYKARTAYLTSPVEGQRKEGGRARVAGGSIIGSSVAVQGAAVPVDSQGRFSSDVSLPENATAVAVRVQHPSSGIHYYVRHLTHAERVASANP